jgi:hypothetical protein
VLEPPPYGPVSIKTLPCILGVFWVSKKNDGL